MTVQWTPEMLAKAATLIKLGVEPRAVASEIDVPLSRLVWLIGYRKDLFETRRRRPKPVAAPVGDVVTAMADARSQARTVAEPVTETARSRGDYQPGLGDLMTGHLFGPAPDGPCGLVHLTSRTCRWPVSGTGAATLFCAARIAPGAGYCDCHRARSNLSHVQGD